MGRKAGIISIDLVAGTAKFNADMAAAKASVREFGTHSVSGVQAASGAIRVIEGNVQNNVRAVERFLVTTLKLGPVLQAAFPIVGAIAFGGMVFKIGEEVAEFFKKMAEAPSRIAGAFRELNQPLRLANDELRVTNDRLANSIAKMEGHRQNLLKLALDEAVVSADKLAQSLEKDLTAFNKLLREENISAWKALLGPAKTSDIKEEFGGETGTGGFFGKVAAETDRGNAAIRAATDLKSKDAAQTEMNTRLMTLYGDELKKVNRWLDEAVEKSKSHQAVVKGRGAEHAGELYNVTVPGSDQAARIELLRGAVRNLQGEMSAIGLGATNSTLSAHKEALELVAPIKEALAELGKRSDEMYYKAMLGERNSPIAKFQEALSKIALERSDFIRKNPEAPRAEVDSRFREQQAAAAATFREDTARLFEEFDKKGEELSRHFAESAEKLGRDTAKLGEDFFREHPEIFGTSNRAFLSGQSTPEQALRDARDNERRNVGLYGARAALAGTSEVTQAYELETLRKKSADEQYHALMRIAERENDERGKQDAADQRHQLYLDAELERQQQLIQLAVRQKQMFEQLVVGATHALMSGNLTNFLKQQGTGIFDKVLGNAAGMVWKDVSSKIPHPGGKLGDLLEGTIFGGGKPDGSSEARALWVRMSGIAAAGGHPIWGGIGGVGTNSPGSVLFGNGGLMGTGSVPTINTPYGGGRASGGAVSPDQAYLVGENGPELLMGASGRIANHAETSRMMNGNGASYYIDARGTDPVEVDRNVKAALVAVHGSAVTTSLRASQDRQRRMPAHA